MLCHFRLYMTLSGIPSSSASLSLCGSLCPSAAWSPLATAYIPGCGVDLEGAPFRSLQTAAASWVLSDTYRNPGPIQFAGATADHPTITLQVLLLAGVLVAVGSVRLHI